MDAWVPLLQTILWVVLIAVAAWKYDLGKIVALLVRRIERGSSFKAGLFEFGEDFKGLDHVKPSAAPALTSNSWTEHRDSIYRRNHGLFLAHVIEPSDAPGQRYNVFIFLVGHKGPYARRR